MRDQNELRHLASELDDICRDLIRAEHHAIILKLTGTEKELRSARSAIRAVIAEIGLKREPEFASWA